MNLYPDFDEVDWVSLARSMGIYLSPDGPFVLEKFSRTERRALAEHLAQTIKDNPKRNRHWADDELDSLIYNGTITSFDKGWIKHLMNKLLKS